MTLFPPFPGEDVVDTRQGIRRLSNSLVVSPLTPVANHERGDRLVSLRTAPVDGLCRLYDDVLVITRGRVVSRVGDTGGERGARSFVSIATPHGPAPRGRREPMIYVPGGHGSRVDCGADPAGKR